MRLDELAGVKQYRNRDFHEWLKDFTRDGGEFLGAGRNATVLGHPRWNHVYKFFRSDRPYIQFVRWAMRNPHPCLPVFLDKPRWVVPFYKRDRSQAKLCLVKMERLVPWHGVDEMGVIRDLEAMDPSFLNDVDHPEQDDAHSMAEYRWWRERMDIWRTAFREDPPLRQLAEFMVGTFRHCPVQGAIDLTPSNIMRRPSDNTYVLTDPFWEGETPLQLHDRLTRAEYEDHEYDEDEREARMIPGGELPKRPRKRKSQSFATPTTYGDDDIPF